VGVIACLLSSVFYNNNNKKINKIKVVNITVYQARIIQEK
jgi:hypothetical protein